MLRDHGILSVLNPRSTARAGKPEAGGPAKPAGSGASKFKGATPSKTASDVLMRGLVENRQKERTPPGSRVSTDSPSRTRGRGPELNPDRRS